jgi:malate dehydrogenase
MGVPSDGSYGIPEGVMFGYPVTCSGGRYEIVKGLEISEFSKGKIEGTHSELTKERADITHLLQ